MRWIWGIAIATVFGLAACGLSVVGSGDLVIADGGEGVDSASASDASSTASGTDGGGGADAAAAEGGACTACSPTCPELCAGRCSSGAYCPATDTCVGSCFGGKTSPGCGKMGSLTCWLCGPDGGAPFEACSTDSTCFGGAYACSCATASDCHGPSETCVNGRCTPCGSGSVGQTCKCNGGCKCAYNSSYHYYGCDDGTCGYMSGCY